MPSSPFALLSFKGLIFTGLGVTISFIWKHKKCSSKKASSTTMNNLPGEVLSEIFTRLLAKQLAQMRCVSKSWNALLSDPSFKKSHLHRSLQNNDEVLLFCRLSFSYDLGPSPFIPCISSSPNVELNNYIKLPVTCQGTFGFGSVIGSVNGLICFSYTSPEDDLIVHIWNPSLSAAFILPPCHARSCKLEFGFGYDPNTDDYKILKLTTFLRAPKMVAKGEVYSMRNGTWKLLPQSFPSHVTICWGQNQVYINGHLHWLCDTELEGDPQMILAFDLDVETINENPLPDVACKCSNVLGVLGGKLCVISRVRDGAEWEVWVMNEFWVGDSWVKHHVFSQFSGKIIPYGFTSRGDFLFQVDRRKDYFGYELRFGFYDPAADKMKTFKIKTNSSESKFVEYVDSLVWVAPPIQS